MDGQLTGPIVGAVVSALLLIVITGGSGMVKALIHLLQEFALLQRDVEILVKRFDMMENVQRTGVRVLESKAGQEFLDPNPVTEYELDIIKRAQRDGSHTLTRDELLTGIQALDREWEEGHIPQEKRGAATRLLAAWNQELRRRDGEEQVIVEQKEKRPPRPPSVLRILWPF